MAGCGRSAGGEEPASPNLGVNCVKGVGGHTKKARWSEECKAEGG